MKQDQTAKAARQRKALPQNTAASDKAALSQASAPLAQDKLRISLNERGELVINEAGARKIADAFAGSNTHSELGRKCSSHLENIRFAQLLAALPHDKGKAASPEALNRALDAMIALAPRDGMEVMLCSPLIALHSQSMDFMARGMRHDQTTDGVDRNVNRAAKLLRMFATMVECLRTYRGGGQQKVTVEHVTVQSGGQAIVGTVNRGAGEGIPNKMVNEPHAKRRGCLKNGNPSGDPSSTPRCGARTRKGTPCGCPAMKNGRCRLHGGLSTGPRCAL